MALFDLKDIVDEAAKKYPPELLQSILAGAIKDAVVGRTITVTFKDGALKVTVG